MVKAFSFTRNSSIQPNKQQKVDANNGQHPGLHLAVYIR